jgi:hypothetical protein
MKKFSVCLRVLEKLDGSENCASDVVKVLRLITVFFFVANKNQKGNQKKISVFLF